MEKQQIDRTGKMFITFGQNHAHALPNILLHKDVVAVIECKTYEEGRKIAFELFESKFCFSYFESEWSLDDTMWYPGGYVKVN